MSTPSQYQNEQQAAVAAAVAAAGVAAGMAGAQLANFTVWMRFLRLIWPAVVLGRRRAAWSARQFYDAERLRVTGLKPLPVPLVEYRFEWFTQNMRPAYDMVVKQIAAARELEKQGLPAPAPKVEATIRVAVARETADAGREQIKRQVKADNDLREKKKPVTEPEPEFDIVFNEDGTAEILDLDEPLPNPVGWARVATGNETCAFCLMLVSRGPVYATAKSAGIADKWHQGCDCKVVPVFDRDDWPGRDAYLKAEKVWKDATRKVKVDPNKLYRVRQKDGTYKMVRLKSYEARTREALMEIRRRYEAAAKTGTRELAIS